MSKCKIFGLLTLVVLLAACEKDDGLDAVSGGGTSDGGSISSNNSATSTSFYTDVLSGIAFDGDAATFTVAFDRTSLGEAEYVDELDEDYIGYSSWDRTIAVHFDDATGATVEGDVNGIVSVSGNDVTVNNVSGEKVQYVLTGSTADGFFKLYGTKKQAIVLAGVSITNPDGAALNNQSKKRTFIVCQEGTQNSLQDGTTYADATDDEDMKACLFSEGQLVLYGPGSLDVDANCKAGIRSDQYVRVMPGANVYVDASSGNALRGNDYVTITGGVLNLKVTGTADKGISTDGSIRVEGGRTTILTSGGYEYDTDDADYSACAGMKADGNIIITAGEVYVQSTGVGGKGLNSDQNIMLQGGKVCVVTTGSRKKDSSGSTSPKGIKADGDVVLSGSHVKVRCTGGEGAEGIEAEGDATDTEGTITVSGGVVEAYTYDDALNSTGDLTVSGGCVYARATGNDAIDANANIYFTGGVTLAEGAGAPECGIDAAEGYTCYINGGTVVAIGGGWQEVASTSKQASVTATVSTGTTVGLLSGHPRLHHAVVGQRHGPHAFVASLAERQHLHPAHRLHRHGRHTVLHAAHGLHPRHRHLGLRPHGIDRRKRLDGRRWRHVAWRRPWRTMVKRQKKSPLAQCQRGFFFVCPDLCDFDFSANLLPFLRSEFRQADGQDAVLHVGSDFVLLDVVRQNQGLLKLRVRELAAQVVGVLVLFLLLVLLLQFDVQVAFVVDLNVEVFLLHARSGEFHFVFLFALNHVDSGCGCFGTRHKIGVEQVVEYAWQPCVSSHHW